MAEKLSRKRNQDSVTESRCRLLTAVILNHEHTELALTQLITYSRDAPEHFDQTEWLIIHNGPGKQRDLEKFQEWAQERPNVRVVSRANHGYGEAYNWAMSQTERPYVLALNADIRPDPQFLPALDHLLGELSSNYSNSGVIGFRLLNEDGTVQGSAGKFPTLFRVVVGLLRPRETRKYVTLSGTTPCEVEWTTGAALLLTRSCFLETGGFDNRYFMYYEDVDLCLRARRAGWKVRVDPRVKAHHLHPYHSRRLSHRTVLFARHGLIRYFWRNRPRWEYFVIVRLVLAECWFRRSEPEWRSIRKTIARQLKDPENDVLSPDDFP